MTDGQVKSAPRTAQQLLEISTDATVDHGVILAAILDEERRQTQYMKDVASTANTIHALIVIGVIVGFMSLAAWVFFAFLY